jgi:hypothetical protein
MTRRTLPHPKPVPKTRTPKYGESLGRRNRPNTTSKGRHWLRCVIWVIWEKRRHCVIVRIGWIKVGFWRSNLDAHFFIWDKKDVVYTVQIGLKRFLAV